MRPYLPRHEKQVREWFSKRGLEMPTLPPTGVIIPHKAAAWLLCTDSDTAIIECLVSNPELGDRSRKEAVRAVIRRLMELAKARGYKQVVGFTQRESVLDICKGLYFKEAGSYSLVIKGL